MGAIENAGPYVEYSIEASDYHPWAVGLLRNRLTVQTVGDVEEAIEVPFGGDQKSGYGREKGLEGLKSDCKVKSVVARIG